MSITPMLLTLQDGTVSSLNINYVPYHWSAQGTFRYYVGHVEEPWSGGVNHYGYKDELQRFKDMIALLDPHGDEWVKCNCIAAIVPPVPNPFRKDPFKIIINGYHVIDFRPSHKTLLSLNRAETPITTCIAQIEGGGFLPLNRRRGWNVNLDLPPYSPKQQKLP